MHHLSGARSQPAASSATWPRNRPAAPGGDRFDLNIRSSRWASAPTPTKAVPTFVAACRLCRTHHWVIDTADWVIQIRDGRPESVPPKWLDPTGHHAENLDPGAGGVVSPGWAGRGVGLALPTATH